MLSSFFTPWCHPSDFKHLPGIWLPLRNKTHIGLSKCGSASLRMIQQWTNPIHKSSLALDPEAVVDAPISAEGMKWSNWCLCADNGSVPSLLSQNCLKLPVLVAEILSGFSKYYLMMMMTKKSGGFWNYDRWWLHLLLNLVILNTLWWWVWLLNFGDLENSMVMKLLSMMVIFKTGSLLTSLVPNLMLNLAILKTLWWWLWKLWWWIWCWIWQSWNSL